MDVGGVQSGFASVPARPSRSGADQTDTRSIRVVVDFPDGRKELVDVFVREEVGCPVRTVQHADFPLVRDARGNAAFSRSSDALKSDVKHITRKQRTTAMPAELPKNESAAAAQIGRYNEAAADCQIGASSR